MRPRQHLDDLPIEVQPNETLAFAVEIGHGLRFLEQGIFERLGRDRSETEKKTPERSNDAKFEHERADGGEGKQERPGKGMREKEGGRAEAENETENGARRKQDCQTMPRLSVSGCLRRGQLWRVEATREGVRSVCAGRTSAGVVEVMGSVSREGRMPMNPPSSL